MEKLLQGLRAAAEPTRLRIIALCGHAELSVTELVMILGQTQPRVSRHLKLLVEGGLLQRNKEGNRAYYRLSTEAEGADLARMLNDLMRCLLYTSQSPRDIPLSRMPSSA